MLINLALEFLHRLTGDSDAVKSGLAGVSIALNAVAKIALLDPIPSTIAFLLSDSVFHARSVKTTRASLLLKCLHLGCG